jgi:hypothetical protein
VKRLGSVFDRLGEGVGSAIEVFYIFNGAIRLHQNVKENKKRMGFLCLFDVKKSFPLLHIIKNILFCLVLKIIFCMSLIV